MLSRGPLVVPWCKSGQWQKSRISFWVELTTLLERPWRLVGAAAIAVPSPRVLNPGHGSDFPTFSQLIRSWSQELEVTPDPQRGGVSPSLRHLSLLLGPLGFSLAHLLCGRWWEEEESGTLPLWGRPFPTIVPGHTLSPRSR